MVLVDARSRLPSVTLPEIEGRPEGVSLTFLTLRVSREVTFSEVPSPSR